MMIMMVMLCSASSLLLLAFVVRCRNPCLICCSLVDLFMASLGWSGYGRKQ